MILKINNYEEFQKIAFLNVKSVTHEQLKNPNKNILNNVATIEEAKKILVGKIQL